MMAQMRQLCDKTEQIITNELLNAIGKLKRSLASTLVYIKGEFWRSKQGIV